MRSSAVQANSQNHSFNGIEFINDNFDDDEEEQVSPL